MSLKRMGVVGLLFVQTVGCDSGSATGNADATSQPEPEVSTDDGGGATSAKRDAATAKASSQAASPSEPEQDSSAMASSDSSGTQPEPSPANTPEPETTTGNTPQQPEPSAEPQANPEPTDDAGAITDAAPQQQPNDGPQANSCAQGDYLLCLDFEDTAVDDIPSGWTRSGDPVAVADDQAHWGAHSLKIGAIPSWRRRIEHDASMVGPEHWGRVFYRVEQPVPDPFVHSSHVTFIGVGPNVGEAEYRYFDSIKAAADGLGIENKLQFIFNVQPNGDEFGSGTGWLDLYYEDTWHCAEWHVNAADQSYAFYYDGELLHSFTNGAGNFNESEIPDSYSLVTLGWTNYQEAPPGFVAWFDDFALANQRIGCDQ